MTRILMVCLGNICRSPLAHGIMESKLDPESYYVDSCGTSAYHIGERPDHRSIAIAKQNGIDITGQSARQFTTLDFDAFDRIYAMDHSNYDNIIKLARDPNDIEKVKLILEEVDTISNKNVPDPYYGGEDGFEHVFRLLDTACNAVAKTL